MDASGHYKSARTLCLLVDRPPNVRVQERHLDHQTHRGDRGDPPCRPVIRAKSSLIALAALRHATEPVVPIVRTASLNYRAGVTVKTPGALGGSTREVIERVEREGGDAKVAGLAVSGGVRRGEGRPNRCRNWRCSWSVLPLSHTTPLSTMSGRLELSCGTQRSASWTFTKDRSPVAICRSCCSGSWDVGVAVIGATVGCVVEEGAPPPPRLR